MPTTTDKKNLRIAILGAGPSGLFMYKRLVESGMKELEISIIERKKQIGAGMPYSNQGANEEHITNVSDNEIPEIYNSIEDWVKTAPSEILDKFNIKAETFNEYKVLPRLFFGEYLSAQFHLLLKKGEEAGLKTHLLLGAIVTDVIDKTETGEVWVELGGKEILKFDKVIICTGHNWPVKHEGKIPGYFDAPYPPAKLKIQLNHPVAIKGSSLTAIDAIRTLARTNGEFIRDETGNLSYTPGLDSPNFKIVMHSRSGMLPAVRFHLDDSHLQNGSLLSPEELKDHIENNNGFLSLDFIFEKNFKDQFREKDGRFYDRIKHMTVEEFVADMIELRERLDPFQLLKAEYAEAAKSIKRKESVYWKEMLGVLSFALNYPAKYLSAEDMQRLQRVLIPLISIVIAYVPQSSCEELLALHSAGILDLVPVGEDSEVEPKSSGGIIYHYHDENHRTKSQHYQTFIDCVGQPHLSYNDFPFKSMLQNKTVSPATIRFSDPRNGIKAQQAGNDKVVAEEDGSYRLKVSGITINDYFQVVDSYGAFNDRVYIMAVPYIGGYNPDYSGLDFCQEASSRIVASMFG